MLLANSEGKEAYPFNQPYIFPCSFFAFYLTFPHTMWEKQTGTDKVVIQVYKRGIMTMVGLLFSGLNFLL